MKAISQETIYNVKILLIPLAILLFLWNPVATMIGAAVLVVLGFAFLMYLASFLDGRSPGQSMFSLERTLSFISQPNHLMRLQKKTAQLFLDGVNDQGSAPDRRFAVAINAIEPGQTELPKELYFIFTYKTLYEYQRKTGSLTYRIGGPRPLVTGGELMRRLSDEERVPFTEFCRTHS